jgi:hypothetical protein
MRRQSRAPIRVFTARALATAALATATLAVAGPAEAATINDLSCESRLSRISCRVTTTTTGTVTITWHVRGNHVPAFDNRKSWSGLGCSPGTSVEVKVTVTDANGTATRTRRPTCRSGNP